jgi:hypothetical protein
MGRKPKELVRAYRRETSSVTFWLEPSLKAALIRRAKTEDRTLTGHLLHLIKQDLIPTPQPTAE